MKLMLLLSIVLIFILGMVGTGLSSEVKGIVTKIEGNKITVKDDKDRETTIELKHVGSIKVGDKIEIRDGRVTIEDGTKEPKKVPEGC